MILIPENEERKFKYGILPNNLKYTIIYDKNSDASNVVMSVRTGSIYEPLQFMGLAHFLEHMLFMGSGKYKDENYFFSKLKEYGGSTNAYTDNYQTVYYFDVISKNLDNIIDIFSRFFIDPLFDVNAVSREINAVNSEHLKNYNNDSWSLRQFIFNQTDKNHIVNRFGTGSHKTLGSDIHKVRDAMIKFYNTYYCSNNMTLTVQSNKPIKDIEKLIKKCFSSIKEKKVSHPIVPIKKFSSYNKEYQLETVRDNDSIIYYWEVPDFYEYKDNKIINIIVNAINLNCKKNLENTLIEAQLISGMDIGYLDIGILILNIDILPNNILPIKIIKKINDMVRYYFNNLKNINWNKIYDYNIKLFELNYNNTIKENNIDLATNICNNMHYYEEKFIYNGNKLVIKKDYNKLYETLEYLLFDKCNIIYGSSKNINKNKMKKEKYYGKYYKKLDKSNIPTEQNSYDFNIYIDNNVLNINPKVIKNLDKYNIPIKLASRFWYGGASNNNEPIVLGTVLIHNKKFFNTIKSYLLSIISISLINYYIKLLFCNEIDIGNNIIFRKKDDLLILGIIGFNDNYIDFFNRVIDNISLLKISDNKIKTDLDIYKKYLENINKDSPWELSREILQSMIHKYTYYYKDELKEINNITIDMVKKRIKQIINIKTHPITTIIYGNIKLDSHEIKKFHTYKINLNTKIDKLPKEYFPKNITIKHPNKNEINCCISFIFPINNDNNYLLIAKLLILNNLMDRPAFDELRTKAQLGYLVSCKVTIDKIAYIKLSVQSAKDYKYVEELMNKFINEQFIKLLNNTNINTFNQIKKSIYDNIKEKPNNLLELSNSYINEIINQEYDFDYKNKTAKFIKDISLNDIKELYHSIIKQKVIIKII